MLIDLVVVLVAKNRSLVLPDSLNEVILLLIEQTDLDERVALSLKSERVCQDGVLEVAYGLLDLVRLGENHSKFVKHFTLLIEVWRHFEHSNQSTDRMVVRLQLLIEDANTIPELRVLDVFQAVKGPLVRVEGVLQVLDEKIAVTKSSPGWSILWIKRNDFDVVLNGGLVLASGSAVLGKFIHFVDITQIGAVDWSFHLFNIWCSWLICSGWLLALTILWLSSSIVWLLCVLVSILIDLAILVDILLLLIVLRFLCLISLAILVHFGL